MLEEIRKLDLEVITKRVEAYLASLSLQSTLLERIKKEQKLNGEGRRIVEAIENGQRKELRLDEYKRHCEKLWVP